MLHLNLLADSWMADNLTWIAATVVVVFGLLVAGWVDVSRFSLKRAWAISGVCFDESIRKRVLWIIPLAIAAVLVVTQLLRAIDAQDAMRQTVKICLFATGMVVMVTSMILACTNLPKEIESRVIYTIVTKPLTRLELTLGKVIGFSRVSLTIVVIMGLLTWAYMRVRAHEKGGEISHRLSEGDIGEVERARLAHYQETGLLRARDFTLPDEMNMYRRRPDLGTPVRIIAGEAAQDVLAGFKVDRDQFMGDSASQGSDTTPQGAAAFGLVARVNISTERTGPANDQETPSAVLGPEAPTAPTQLLPPMVSVDIFDESRFSIAASSQLIGASTPQQLIAAIAEFTKTLRVDPKTTAADLRLSDVTDSGDSLANQSAYVWIPPNIAAGLAAHPEFYVRIIGVSKDVDFRIGPRPVRLFIPRFQGGGAVIEGPGATEIPPAPGRHGEPMELVFRGSLGLHAEQSLKGGPEGVAVYAFRGTPPPVDANGNIQFELSAIVDRSNSDVEEGHEDATTLDLELIDLKSQNMTHSVVHVDSQQTAFFSFPATSLTSPDFDLVVHCRNVGHTVGFYLESMRLVQGQRSFELNLAKSLLIIWMMSILVVALAVLCSTFLSWPIAIVLTMVLLLGHWGADQLAESSGPGLGRQIVNDFKFTDAPVAKVVSSSVDALAGGMRYFAKVLPDTSRFEAIEDIEQGVSVPAFRLIDALEILAAFALPATVIAYVILKFREVAP